MRTGGIRFSADEWYLRLFHGEDPTHQLDDAQWRRLMDLLDDIWPPMAERGIDVILDFGFWSRESRDRAGALALGAGADVVVYQVTCDERLARQRCAARNTDPQGSFLIDDDAFDSLRSKFEQLEEDEIAAPIDTNE